ncbi:MAG TPA: dienelactone hydrolase family protein [Syntrophales bacterium]|nr:dienelactone hydrolase family protein [Syntrophales bacterium]
MSGNREREVVIQDDDVRLAGILGLPRKPRGVIAFAHGSGSSRLSPRNTFVARALQDAGLATFLFDLLEEEEELDRRKVFDIGLLADRLIAGARWLQNEPATSALKIGYFGASTGAAAALHAAARGQADVEAVVSRGGRPDLAMDYLDRVNAPTLLIVGGDDRPVIPLNREAFKELKCVKELVVIPGATHLFQEPGALEEVAKLAVDWFLKYVVPKNKR